MRGKKAEESIAKPATLRGFKQQTVLCIPYDPPGSPMLKYAQKTAKKEKKFPLGRLFILDNKALLYGVVGAPALCLCLETLIASGVRHILFLGFCGAIHPDISLMTAVSAAKAYSEEGTSRHYLPKKRVFHPSTSLKSEMEDLLTANGLPFISGTVVSTDAPYRETPRWLSRQQSRGIDCVDMEVSAVFSLAEFHGVQAAALLLVSDSLAGGRWKKAFSLIGASKAIKDCFFPFFHQDFPAGRET